MGVPHGKWRGVIGAKNGHVDPVKTAQSDKGSNFSRLFFNLFIVFDFFDVFENV